MDAAVVVVAVLPAQVDELPAASTAVPTVTFTATLTCAPKATAAAAAAAVAGLKPRAVWMAGGMPSATSEDGRVVLPKGWMEETMAAAVKR